MSNLLFVDDDQTTLEMNKDFFSQAGFTVYTASGYSEAVKYLEGYPLDCIILDILMPGEGGLEICEKIRSKLSVPIIFLTGFTEKEYLYKGFSLGGDDYLTKPYDFGELEMRIRAAVNRYKGLISGRLTVSYPAITIDESSHTVMVNGAEVVLTAYEFDVLLLLAKHPGQVFSADRIYREVWGMPDIKSVQTVQVHMARMRHKLERACADHQFIKTVWKQGYKFLPDIEDN